MKKILFISLSILGAILLSVLIFILARQNNIENISTDSADSADEIELDATSGEKGILASNKAADFYFYYPENFKIDKNAAMISVYISDMDIVQSDRQNLGTEENEENQSYFDYIVGPNLSAVKLPDYAGYESVEKYWENAVNEMGIIWKNIEVEPAEDVTVDGIPAKKYTYTADLAGMTFKYSQVIFFNKRNVYTLTYTALPEKFDKYVNVLDTAVETFRFK